MNTRSQETGVNASRNESWQECRTRSEGRRAPWIVPPVGTTCLPPQTPGEGWHSSMIFSNQRLQIQRAEFDGYFVQARISNLPWTLVNQTWMRPVRWSAVAGCCPRCSPAWWSQSWRCWRGRRCQTSWGSQRLWRLCSPLESWQCRAWLVAWQGG